jgi:hypothetical protein
MLCAHEEFHYILAIYSEFLSMSFSDIKGDKIAESCHKVSILSKAEATGLVGGHLSSSSAPR